MVRLRAAPYTRADVLQVLAVLLDIEALVRNGQNLRLAIADAPRRDAGFSPLTLAWLLRDWDVRAIANAAGLSEAEGQELDAFRHSLLEDLIAPDAIA